MSTWSELLSSDTLNLCNALLRHTQQEREEGKVLYPTQENILRALRLTPPDKTKVVIVWQDPYHTPGVANGLAFSCGNGGIAPSLRNIYKECCGDLGWDKMPEHGDLTSWAEQGVLLLNTTLTVYEHKPNSHQSWGWNIFTSEILTLCAQLPQLVVFMLWGADAINLQQFVILKAVVSGERSGIIKQNLIKKYILSSSHPSPLSATRWCKGNPPF